MGVRLEDLELCDRCADHRIAAATGWPELPPAPAAELLVGPDGQRHVFTYRLFRWPGRVTAVAEEKTADGAPGYRLEVGIDHAEDPSLLGQRIRKAARIAVACQYLEWDDRTGRWGLSGNEVGGYLVEIDDNPYSNPGVAVDGRAMSWDELGELVQSCVGRSFHLRLGQDASEVGYGRPAHSLPFDERAQRLAQLPPPWYVIAIDHYPTHNQWRRRKTPG